MARPSVHPKSPRSAASKGLKSTQRERIVAGMITAANRDGYAGASVSAVIAEGGVSRPTFYEYFADRDACFLATILEVQDRLMIGLRDRVKGEAPQHALYASVRALIEFAAAEPAMARFLM